MTKLLKLGDDVILYHVSPIVNWAQILKDGVNPAFSRGSAKTAWWREERALQWAIIHTSMRWATPASSIAVFVTRTCYDYIQTDGFVHHGQGRYFTSRLIVPEFGMPMDVTLAEVFGEGQS